MKIYIFVRLVNIHGIETKKLPKLHVTCFLGFSSPKAMYSIPYSSQFSGICRVGLNLQSSALRLFIKIFVIIMLLGPPFLWHSLAACSSSFYWVQIILLCIIFDRKILHIKCVTNRESKWFKILLNSNYNILLLGTRTMFQGLINVNLLRNTYRK